MSGKRVADVDAGAVTAMRRSGVPLSRVRSALDRLDGEFGLGHALASKRLYTDGSEVLFDYAEQDLDSEVSGRSGSWSWCVAGSGLQRDCRRVPPAPRVR